MKSPLLLLLASVLSVGVANGQIIPSSCDADQSILELYQNDADILALEHIYALQSTYVDSISIPTSISDTMMRALMAVYNLTTVAARDSVVNMYDIHHFTPELLNAFDVSADSSVSWMENLEANQIPCGNADIDDAIANYGFTVTDYSDFSGQLALDVVTLESSTNFNLLPLTSQIENNLEVSESNPVQLAGDGNRIAASITSTYVALTFTYAWGDCPSGCIWSHDWDFRVYYDCGVEYMGSSGDPIKSVGISDHQNTTIQIYPNPTSENIFVERVNGAFRYQIVDLQGRMVQSGGSQTPRIDIAHLPAGAYTLILEQDNAASTNFTFLKSTH